MICRNCSSLLILVNGHTSCSGCGAMTPLAQAKETIRETPATEQEERSTQPAPSSVPASPASEVLEIAKELLARPEVQELVGDLLESSLSEAGKVKLKGALVRAKGAIGLLRKIGSAFGG